MITIKDINEAEDPRTPAWRLTNLLDLHDPEIDAHVANNKNATEGMLEGLALKPSMVTRHNVTQNANTTSQILEYLKNDSNPFVLRGLEVRLNLQSGELQTTYACG